VYTIFCCLNLSNLLYFLFLQEVEKERAKLEDQLQQVTDHCDLLTQRYEETTKNLNKLQELLQESDHERHQLKGHNQILELQVQISP